MTGIINRKGTFYFRQRIPSDLRQYFDRRHLRRSLHTKDANAAKALGASISAKVQHVFTVLRTGVLHPAEAKALVANLLAVNLADVRSAPENSPGQHTQSPLKPVLNPHINVLTS